MNRGSVYKQGEIVAELERRLDEGFYSSGFPVGSLLAAEFGVNIKTINKAINQLVEAGRLARKRGVGTFVVSHTAGDRQVEVLFEGYSALFDHPFWGEIWNGCITGLLDAGFRPVLTQIQADESGRLQLEGFRFSPTMGKLLLGITHPRFLELVSLQGVPAVSAGDEIDDPDFPQVCFDYWPGVRDAMTFLVKRGCRRIAFLGETRNEFNPKLLNKFHAWRRALESLGVYDPELAEHTRPLPEAAGSALRSLLGRTKPDAVFVAGDHQVPCVERVLKENGLRLPVVGCDGLAFANWPTVSLPRRAAGEAAARLLATRMRGNISTDRVVLSTHFVC